MIVNKNIKNIILIPQKLNKVITIGGMDIPLPLTKLLKHSKIAYKKQKGKVIDTISFPYLITSKLDVNMEKI